MSKRNPAVNYPLIDLPLLPERTYIVLEFAASRVEIPESPNERHYQCYPKESIADWHQRLGLVDETEE
jgi:hypothetical protein